MATFQSQSGAWDKAVVSPFISYAETWMDVGDLGMEARVAGLSRGSRQVAERSNRLIRSLFERGKDLPPSARVIPAEAYRTKIGPTPSARSPWLGGPLGAAGDDDFDVEGGLDVVEFAEEGAGDGREGFGVAADGDGDVLVADDGAAGGVEAFPAGAAEKDLRPSVGGAESGGDVFGGGVAADEAGGQAEEAAGLDEQGGEVAAGAAADLKGAGGALHAGFFASGVGEVAGDGAVHLVDEGVGFDELAGAPELADPGGDGGLVVEVGGDEVGAELDAFAGEEEEGEVNGAVLHEEVERLVVIVLDDDVAADDELVDRGGVEVGEGD